jgi:5-methylcytosine-specific restriction endonuclease McrA
MTYAELFDVMSDLSLQALESKKFGKKRVVAEKVQQKQNHQQQASPPPTQEVKAPLSTNARYIPRSIKYHVWRRDHGKCTNCQSKRNLNYDHVTPVALGGASTLENLRLLCFQCNQRASTRVFGTRPTRGNPALSSQEIKQFKQSNLWQ